MGFGCAGFMKKPQIVDGAEAVLMPRKMDAGLDNGG